MGNFADTGEGGERIEALLGVVLIGVNNQIGCF